VTVREIITLPEPVLRKKARKISNFNLELQTLIDDMVETMRAAPGVGLAAPQVNVPLRVIVVEFGDEEDEEFPPKLYIIVNPELSKFSKELVSGTEGCLSIPGFMGEVERSETVVIKGYNRHGQPLKIKAKGWLARIFQHEVDHLDGILYIDRTDKIMEIQEEPVQVSPPD
jgi:peptide deformylase